ncbi:MAG: ROK family protein [Candidatus Nealsonbacteria bacterium]
MIKTKRKNYIIGIDIGGTRTAVLFLKNRKVIKRKMIATPKDKITMIRELKRAIEEIILPIDKSKVRGIGIAVAGSVDSQKGIILVSPNLLWLKNLALARILEQKLGIPVKMDNDANCFALAEATLGAGKGVKNLVGITLGTGVGGCIILDGKIYHGAHGLAGEIGHIIVIENGRKCACGLRGCLEQYASSQYMLWKAKDLSSTEEIAKRARMGNKKFLKIYAEVGYYLGIGLVDIINAWDPEMIIIGGGLIHGWQWILPSIKKEIKKDFFPSARMVKIKKAELGGDYAGSIGAALLFKD